MNEYLTELVQNYGAWLGAGAALLLALDRIGALLESVAAKTATKVDDRIAAGLRFAGKAAGWLALKFGK